MGFTVDVERNTDLFLNCNAQDDCRERADFTLNDVAACRKHLWIILMHEYRVSIDKPCLSERCKCPPCALGRYQVR